MCLDGLSVVKVLRRVLRPVSSSSGAASVDRLEQRPLLMADVGRDVVMLDRAVHRQIMSDMDSYRTSLLHLQQVLLQQQVCLSVCLSVRPMCRWCCRSVLSLRLSRSIHPVSSHLISADLILSALSAVKRHSLLSLRRVGTKYVVLFYLWLVTATANWVATQCTHCPKFRLNEVSWDDEMSYMNAPSLTEKCSCKMLAVVVLYACE